MSRLDGDRFAVAGAAFADGTATSVRRETTLLVEDGRVAGLWHDGSGSDPESLGVPVLDGSGATIVPGLVDSRPGPLQPRARRPAQRSSGAVARLAHPLTRPGTDRCP